MRNGEPHGHNNTATDELFGLRHGGDFREVDGHEATALNEGCELLMEVSTEDGSKVIIEEDNGVENIS